MYSIDAEGAKERRKDLRRLRKLLRKESFAEDLEWFGRKVIDSEVPRKFEIAFATYLSLLIRVDNRLFLGRTFWNVKSPRVRLVHYLLMKRGYAETIIKLARGAANLSEQTRHHATRGTPTMLREIADEYERSLKEHREKIDGAPFDRNSAWNMIRISNKALAKIYDIIYDGTIILSWRLHNYEELLQRPTQKELEREEMMPAMLFLLGYRGLRRRKMLNKFKTRPKNKRKNTNWKSV